MFGVGCSSFDVHLPAMIIGVPKEIKQQENRVGLLPSAAYQLIKRGHRVLVTAGAGVGSGYPDEEYTAAGAEVIGENADVFATADMIVKVKEPLPIEYAMLRKGQILSHPSVCPPDGGGLSPGRTRRRGCRRASGGQPSP